MTRASRARRGANAIEFALVSPVLAALMLATIDYGWFFMNQWLVMNAAAESVRLGATQSPDEEDPPGACPACETAARNHLAERLTELGLTADDGDPQVVGVEGTCALELRATVTHQALVGFVPLPDSYSANVVWALPHVEGC